MSSLTKNIGFSIITFSSKIISGSLVYIILARLMSLDDFGLLSFGTTLAGILTVMGEFGFSLMAQRDIPQERFKFEDYVINTFIQKFIFTGIALIGGLIYLGLFYTDNNFKVGVIFILNAVIASNTMYFFAMYRAKNLFKIESWLSLVYSVLIIVLITLYYILNLDVLFIAYGLLFSRTLQLIILVFIFFSKFKCKFNIDKKIQQYLVKNSFSFGAHYIIGIFYFSIDNQMIAYYSGNEQLAIYQAFFKIVMILLMVNELLEGVFLPFLASHFDKGSKKFENYAKLINKVIVAFGILLFVFFVLFASDIMNFFYNDKYSKALIITLPLAIILFARILATVYSVILTISNNQNLRVLIVFISLVVNVILNFTVIPKYGFSGAAYVSMITHILLVSLYVFFGYKQIGNLILDKKTLLFMAVTIITASIVLYLKISFSLYISLIILATWVILTISLFNKSQLVEIKHVLRKETY